MLRRPRIEPPPLKKKKKKERKEGRKEGMGEGGRKGKKERVKKKADCLLKSQARHAWVLHRGQP